MEDETLLEFSYKKPKLRKLNLTVAEKSAMDQVVHSLRVQWDEINGSVDLVERKKRELARRLVLSENITV